MRLKNHEQSAIVETIKSFDTNARVYLFGSRVDDTKLGGDIDLLVFSECMTSDNKRAVRIKLYELLGEQKIDIVLAKDDADPFVKMALTNGVEL